MDERAIDIKDSLSRMKKIIDELLASFDETVEQQAEKMTGNQRKKLRDVFKIEQNEAHTECKRIKLETEELIKDIGRSTRKGARDLKLEHNANLRAVLRKEQQKNGESSSNDSRSMQEEIVDITGTILTPRCAACGKEDAWLCFCGACKVTRYCNEECQRRDWEKHMRICKGLRRS